MPVATPQPWPDDSPRWALACSQGPLACEFPQIVHIRDRLQLIQRLDLELAYPLTGHVEQFAQVFQRDAAFVRDVQRT